MLNIYRQTEPARPYYKHCQLCRQDITLTNKELVIIAYGCKCVMCSSCFPPEMNLTLDHCPKCSKQLVKIDSSQPAYAFVYHRLRLYMLMAVSLEKQIADLDAQIEFLTLLSRGLHTKKQDPHTFHSKTK